MSDHDERRLSGIGREVWPEPEPAYRELLAAGARRRRRAAGLMGIAAVAAVVAVAAFVVLPGGQPARNIVVGGGLTGGITPANAGSPAPPTPGSGPATLPASPTAQSNAGNSVVAGPYGAVVDATDANGADPRFEPATVTITVGESVKFVNTGAAAHMATGSNGSSSGTFNTGNLNPGQSATTPAFETPGVYTYHCAYHQALGMVGTIVVVPLPSLGGPAAIPGGAIPLAPPTPNPGPASPASPRLPRLITGKTIPSPGVNP